MRLLPEHAIDFLDRVGDLGVGGIGQRPVRAGKGPELSPAVVGLGVSAGERGLEDRRVAFLAAGLADVRAGLLLQGVIAAVRPGAGHGRQAPGPVPFLEVGAAEQPGGLRVGPSVQDRL